ncbi:hypothetical protein [Desulfosarcina variabilis]
MSQSGGEPDLHHPAGYRLQCAVVVGYTAYEKNLNSERSAIADP